MEIINSLPPDFPIVLLIFLILINIFKAQLFKLLEGFASHLGNKSAADIAIEESIIKNSIERAEYQQLRSSYIDEQLLEIINDKEKFERELFLDLSKAIENNTAALNAVRDTNAEVIKTLERLSELIKSRTNN